MARLNWIPRRYWSFLFDALIIPKITQVLKPSDLHFGGFFMQ